MDQDAILRERWLTVLQKGSKSLRSRTGANRHPVQLFLVALFLALSLTSCSIEKMAMRRVADLLAGSSSESEVFTGEEDVELVGEALPFALKIYESLLESVQDSPELYLTTGKAFALYSRAYVQMPAEMLPDVEFDAKVAGQARAKKLYLRARRYVLAGLDLRHPGISQILLGGEDWETALEQVTVEDIDWVYWGALTWMGALTADTFDLEMLLSVPRAASMMARCLELNEGYDDGGIHEFYVSYYGSLPPDMGGSDEKARSHYEKALEYSGGKKASTHVALATTVSIRNQDHQEFRSLLDQALAIDVDQEPGLRLANLISQRQAAWLLENIEDFFLLGGDE
jgi:predicted anti-sigma-YlaC factor YlaD